MSILEGILEAINSSNNCSQDMYIRTKN